MLSCLTHQKILAADIDDYCQKVSEAFIKTEKILQDTKRKLGSPGSVTTPGNLYWTKRTLFGCQDKEKKEDLQQEYRNIFKEVKSSTKDDKRKYLDDKANEAQKAADRGTYSLPTG